MTVCQCVVNETAECRCVGRLRRPLVVAVSSTSYFGSARPAERPPTYAGLVPSGPDQRQFPETAVADERCQRLSDVRVARDARRRRRPLPRQQFDLHPSHGRHRRLAEPVVSQIRRMHGFRRSALIQGRDCNPGLVFPFPGFIIL